jgi:hypothetical protein
MNHRHRKVLHALFDHPISANIDFKEVETMLRELGAEIDNRSGARIGVKLGNRSAFFHHANHSLHKDEVVKIKHFLVDCGIDPSQFPV